MNGRSSLSLAHYIGPKLCHIVGHGAAWLQYRFIKACPTATMTLSARCRWTLRCTKQLRVAGNRPIQPQPRQLRMIVATVDAKSP
jgi:hypothetical protein